MRKIRLLALSAFLAIPIVGGLSGPAHACTSTIEPDVCEIINRVCERVAGGRCLG
jgi:hypothetical protein